MRNRGTGEGCLTRCAVPRPLREGTGSPWAPVGASGTLHIKRSSPLQRGYQCKLPTAGRRSRGQLAEQTRCDFGQGIRGMQLGDGQSARPKPLRWHSRRASWIAAAPGWQQGKKNLSLCTELGTTSCLQRQKGSDTARLPAAPQLGCEPLPGLGKKILKSRGIPRGPGGSVRGFHQGLASRSGASTFPIS